MPEVYPIVDGLLRLWGEPLPADDEAALAAFRAAYTDPVRINGSDMAVVDLVKRARVLQAAFADLHAELIDQVVAPGKTVIVFRQTGRHVGPLPTPLGPVAPTGRTVTGLGIDVLTITGGKISQIWVLADELQRLVALDAVALTAS